MSVKNRAFVALLLISCFGSSCQKMTDFSVMPPQDNVKIQPGSSKVENLGHVFSGTNVNWKIHPSSGGQQPLLMHLPYNNTGYNVLMIDNGKLNGYTPVQAFKFISVNLYTKNSKIISIVSKATGQPVLESVGRTTRMTFGMNKKFYIATEGSAGGGGHIIEYDPNTEKAYDLGKPFKNGNRYLDIYSLSVGTDGALYGGSFGGDGDLFTFRYDYNGSWYVDQAPIDNELRYVINVSGDSRYTYAACGKNKWKVVAIDRTTGAKKVVLSTNDQIGNLDVYPHTDGVYSKMYQHYKMNGLNAPGPLPYPEHPNTPRVFYNPYNTDDVTVPEVEWVSNTKKIEYRFPSGEQGVISVNGVYEDIYETTLVNYTNNNVYIAGGKPSALAVYNNGKASILGSFPFNVYCQAKGLSNTADANKLFFSGYPKGNLYEYNLNQSWSLTTLPGTSNGSAPVATNPSSVAMMQNADGAGTYGPMSSGGVVYTKNGYIVVSGNNDRITGSASRELSIGSYKNNCVKNLYQNEFTQYEFMNICLSADSNYALVVAFAKSGGSGKIFKYDPASNSIIDSWTIAEIGISSCFVESLSNNLIVCAAGDAIFVYDLQKRQVMHKKVFGGGQGVSSFVRGANGVFYFSSSYLQAGNSKIQKLKIDMNASYINFLFTFIAEVKDQDGGEGRPNCLSIVPSTPGFATIYVAGLKSLYRINNVQL